MDIKPPPASGSSSQSTGISPSTELPASLQPLPRGTPLIATVETSSAAAPQASGSKIFDILLNINGNKIQTQSNHAFSPGQLLKVEITANAALRVIQVAAQQTSQLNPASLQIQQGLRQALPLQQNSALLLNNLAPLFKLLEATQAAQAKAQIRELLSTIPDFKQLANPATLKNSVIQSGIFLESKMKLLETQLQQNSSKNTQNTTQQSINNREALANLLRDNVQFSKQLEKLVGQDFKAQLLKLSSVLIPLLARTGPGNATSPAEAALLQRILQVLPDTRGSQLSGTSSAAQGSLPLSNLPITTQLLQLLNANVIPGQSQAQQPLQATPSQTNNNMDLAISTVLRQIAATLSQVQSNQLQSLAGARGDADGGVLLNSWNIEIPVLLEGQFKPIQLQINEERHPEASTTEQEKTRVWKITLSFDFEELGEFFATLRIIDTSVSTTFWSEKPETLQRISSELRYLNKSLQKLGLNVEELECRRGKPILKETRLDQQLVDIKT